MAIRRLMAALLAFSMLGASVPAAVAADDGAATRRTATEPGLSASAKQVLDRTLEAAAFEAATQRSRRTRRSNPYGVVSYVLMGAGGGLTVYGLTHTTGVECDFGGANIGCKTTRSKGGAFPISRSRAHTHRRHGHPLQTVPSAGLIERPQEKNRVDALR